MTALTGLERRAAAAAQAIVEDLDAPVLDEEDRRHLLVVRRLRDGEHVVLTDGRGSWRLGEVVEGDVRPIGEHIVEERSGPPTTVAFAPVKGDRSDWAVAKLTELGVDRIVALVTDRATVRWRPEAAERALERWRRIAREAACQARRVWLPVIEGPLRIDDLVAEGAPMALGTIGGPPLTGGEQIIAIGPEGGWSDKETDRGITPVGLAGQVLRTETAAVAAGVLLSALRAGTVRPVNHDLDEGRRQ